jgi:hypothetical protein
VESISCRLQCTQNLSETTWLPGIAVASEGIRLEPEYFTCCEEMGTRRVGFRTFERCDLRPRFGRLAAHFSCFAASWPGAAMLPPQFPERRLATLKGIATGKVGKGWRLTGGVESPSDVWAIAAMAVWYCNIFCHVIRLGQGKDRNGIDLSFAKGWTEGRGMILIEGVDAVPTSDQIFNLELLINFAYNSDLPMWIAMDKRAADPGESKQASRATSATSQFRRKFEKERVGEQAFFWLSAAARDRLAAVCNLG